MGSTSAATGCNFYVVGLYTKEKREINYKLIKSIVSRPTTNEAIICVASKYADDVLFLNVGDCGYRTLSCRMDSKIISPEYKSNIRSGPQILLPKETMKADQYYQLWMKKFSFFLKNTSSKLATVFAEFFDLLLLLGICIEDERQPSKVAASSSESIFRLCM